MPHDIATTARLVRQDLRTARPWLAVFDTPQCSTVLEYRTPRVMRGGNPLQSERTTLRLWQTGAPGRVLVEVDLSTNDPTDIEPALDAVADAGQGRAGAERDLFELLLRLVREHHLGLHRRPRARQVGDTITSRGAPSLEAWASCLTMADLQEALQASAA